MFWQKRTHKGALKTNHYTNMHKKQKINFITHHKFQNANIDKPDISIYCKVPMKVRLCPHHTFQPTNHHPKHIPQLHFKYHVKDGLPDKI